jgi:hypothetical protein
MNNRLPGMGEAMFVIGLSILTVYAIIRMVIYSITGEDLI